MECDVWMTRLLPRNSNSGDRGDHHAVAHGHYRGSYMQCRVYTCTDDDCLYYTVLMMTVSKDTQLNYLVVVKISQPRMTVSRSRSWDLR